MNTTGTRPVRRMFDKDVLDCDGQHLGKVLDVVLHFPTGRAAYVVVEVGYSFAGRHNKLFAIPWEALSLESDETYRDRSTDRRLQVNMSAKDLEKAPGFDKDNWPDPEDFEWLVPVYEFYACTPFWL